MCSDNPLFENQDLCSSPGVLPESKTSSVLEEECDKWGVGREQLVAAQNTDVSLSHCMAAAVDKAQLPQCSTAYFFDGDVLMRKWTPPNSEQDWRSVFQVVLPKP